MRAPELWGRCAFDVYAPAQPVARCERCGAPVYDGDRVARDEAGRVVACEQCTRIGPA